MGKIALRELFGLFFLGDQTLTIYEHRSCSSVSQNSNGMALPFLPRHVYKQAHGRKRTQLIQIWDIFKGSVFYVPIDEVSKKTLPDSLHKLDYLEVEVVNLMLSNDLEAKVIAHFLAAEKKSNNNEKIFDESELIARVRDRLANPVSAEELKDKKIIESVRTFIREQIGSRSVEIYTNMARKLRKKQKQKSPPFITQSEFCDALLEHSVLIHSEDVFIAWQVIDTQVQGQLSSYTLMRAFFGEMNETRHGVFRQLLLKLDPLKRGYVQVNDIYKYYKAGKHPRVQSGEISVDKLFERFLSSFALISAKKLNELNELALTQSADSTASMFISYEELEDFYSALSICLNSDKEFLQILQNSWNI